MYGFYDFQTASDNVTTSIHQLIYDGVNLDETFTTDISTFITLSVSGRGIAQRKHMINEQDGVDGAMFEAVNYLPRTMTVKAKVAAASNDEFRMLMQKLNVVFSNRQEVDIQFTDEPYTYAGHFLTSTQPEETSNEQIIEITVFCGDPFKYSTVRHIDNYTNGGLLNVDSDFPVRPNIEMTYTEPLSALTVTNTTTGDVLEIENDGSTATYIIELDRSISFNRNISGLIHKHKLEHLLLSSDLRDFNMKQGDRIVIQPAPTTINIQYKGVKL